MAGGSLSKSLRCNNARLSSGALSPQRQTSESQVLHHTSSAGWLLHQLSKFDTGATYMKERMLLDSIRAVYARISTAAVVLYALPWPILYASDHRPQTGFLSGLRRRGSPLLWTSRARSPSYSASPAFAHKCFCLAPLKYVAHMVATPIS